MKSNTALKPNTEIAGVIEIHHKKPMVSSLKIAALLDRSHDQVLRAIRKVQSAHAGLDALVETSLDIQGKERPVYWLNEREALIVMPYVGGSKSVDGQTKLVDAYLFYRNSFPNPPRDSILEAKRKAHNPMMDALVEFRADLGKSTEPKHFMCENKLCNWAVTGKFAAIDEKTLSNEDAALLEKVRVQNRAMIDAGQAYEVRKKALHAFAMRKRTKLIGN